MSATGAPPSAVNDGTTPLVQWSALFAGAVAASGISFTLLAFGTGIGLAVMSSSPTWRDSSPVLWVLSGLWLILVALCAFGFGGYITGRMRTPFRVPVSGETEFRDGMHGVIMWGLAVVVTAVLGIAGAMALTPAVAPQGSSIGPSASVAGEATIAADVDLLLRSMRAAPLDAGLAYRRAEVSRILLKANSSAGIPSEDRNYLASIVTERTGLSTSDAAARTERVIGLAAVDLHRARVAAVIEAFMICAALLLGAAVAWYSAVEGGRDRQRGTLPVWDWRFAQRQTVTK
jgi:hypothetical protein